MEKQDILQNYRDANAEGDRLQETIKHLTEEHTQLYQKCLEMEKNNGGSQYMLKEMK